MDINITIDSLPPAEPIVSQSYCHRIRLKEENGGTTAGFIVHRRLAGNPSTLYPAGDEVEFIPPNGGRIFTPGEIVAYMEAETGVLVMVQKED